MTYQPHLWQEYSVSHAAIDPDFDFDMLPLDELLAEILPRPDERTPVYA